MKSSLFALHTCMTYGRVALGLAFEIQAHALFGPLSNDTVANGGVVRLSYFKAW